LGTKGVFKLAEAQASVGLAGRDDFEGHARHFAESCLVILDYGQAGQVIEGYWIHILRSSALFRPAAVFCQVFHRRRFVFGKAKRTSLTTGLESRVMRISSSTCKAASVSGQRWRKSRIVIVFTAQV
jgi:hypothetical protein